MLHVKDVKLGQESSCLSKEPEIVLDVREFFECLT